MSMSHDSAPRVIPDDWDADIPEWEESAGAPPATASIVPAQAVQVAPAAPAAPISVPFEFLGRRGHLPGFLSRSAVFSVSARIGAAPLINTRVASSSLYELTYSGPPLSMRDKAVYQCVITQAQRSREMGAPMRLSLTQIARDCGFKDESGAGLASVFASVQRLAAASLDFKLRHGPKGGGSLLSGAQKTGNKHSATLDAPFAAAFLLDTQYAMRLERKALLSSDLAHWLHDHFTVNEEYEDGEELGPLRAMCGHVTRESRFPSLLAAALTEINKRVPALVAGFEIERRGRASSEWLMRVQRGAAKPQFEEPPALKAAREESRKRKKEARDKSAKELGLKL